MPILLQLAQSYSNPDSVNYKIAYLQEKIGDKDFGKLAFEDQVQLAMLGETVIVGGFLRTELIAAKSIHAEHLNVEDLSAITGKFTSLMAGNPFGARLEMGESAGEPFLDMYDESTRRVRLLKDRLNFYTPTGTSAGFISGGTDDGGNPRVVLDGDLFIKSADGGLSVYETLLRLYAFQTVHAGYFRYYISDTRNYLQMYVEPEGGRIYVYSANDSSYPGHVVIYAGGRETIRIYQNNSIRINTHSDGGYTFYFDRSGTYGGNTRPTLRPSADTFGFIGTPTHRFYQMFAQGGFLTSSEKRLKTNIAAADTKSCYDQVKALQFKTYKLKGEIENAATPEDINTYLGIIAEEAPDIICDKEKKNINLYPYISLIGAAVQEIQGRLEAIEKQLNQTIKSKSNNERRLQ